MCDVLQAWPMYDVLHAWLPLLVAVLRRSLVLREEELLVGGADERGEERETDDGDDGPQRVARGDLVARDVVAAPTNVRRREVAEADGREGDDGEVDPVAKGHDAAVDVGAQTGDDDDVDERPRKRS